jgi:hypothetical protein
VTVDVIPGHFLSPVPEEVTGKGVLHPGCAREEEEEKNAAAGFNTMRILRR